MRQFSFSTIGWFAYIWSETDAPVSTGCALIVVSSWWVSGIVTSGKIVPMELRLER